MPIVDIKHSNDVSNIDTTQTDLTTTCRSKDKKEFPNIDVPCRICLETNFRQVNTTLLQPCACSGSIGTVHEECLKEAIIFRAKTSQEPLACEICKNEYKMTIEIEKRIGLRGFTKKNYKLIILTVFLTLLLLTIAVAFGLLVSELVRLLRGENRELAIHCILCFQHSLGY